MAKNPAQTTTKDPLTNFAVRIARIHAEAHSLGLHETGQKLHAAVQSVGWEIARKCERELLLEAQRGNK